MDEIKFQRRLDRERHARKEAENLLERKSLELWELNQDLELQVKIRTQELELALKESQIASEAKGAFLSNMSHEIRTPLNAIIGFVDILTSSTYEKEIFDKYLNIIQVSGKNLLSIINQILDYSKIQSGKLSMSVIEVDIRTLLGHVYELFLSIAKDKNVNYQLNISNNVPQFVKLDDTRITQVMSNFISNALKFTNDQGSVNINVDYNNEKNLLMINVVDTGIGISASAIGKIFEVFEQEDTSTTREFGGTGLGLPICKKLIEMMNGKIIVNSEKGKGSSFGFELFVESIESIDILEYADTKQTDKLLSGNILIAEDNEVNVMLLEIILEDYDVEYTIVENGLLAVEAVENNSTFDLVFMDNQMPKLNGIEATKRIRLFNQNIPIIAFSANVLEGEQKLFLDAGMNDALAKPIDIKAFEKILVRYLS